MQIPYIIAWGIKFLTGITQFFNVSRFATVTACSVNMIAN